ncbi:MAG TPA: D-alanyl-D-alanine carboxypeptidase/D-alanyl-D-alanine-endopeptidase [Steroidobacteraceae bacterium]
MTTAKQALERWNRCRIQVAAILVASTLGFILAAPARADWRALEALTKSGALVSAEALDLDNGTVIQQMNAATRLTPASLTKLTVAAATLNRWAADKAFETQLLGSGTLRGGELTGDVILGGAGDPTLEYHALLALAMQAAGAGVASVRGRVLVNLAPFADVGCETHDRCSALLRSDTAFNAPLSAVGVDYGNWCISVQSGTAGAPAAVRGCGVSHLPIAVEGSITTGTAQSKKTFWVERVTSGGVDALRVGGQLPLGSRERVYRAMSNPAMGVGILLRESLREIGVRVSGDVLVTKGALPSNVLVLGQTEGFTLREQLGRMLRFSNNYIADVLTFDLAADMTGAVPAGLADASKGLSEFVLRALRAQSRTRTTAPPLLLSGSGLTPQNELSANDLVALLAYQYHDSRNFPAFYGGLTVPRQAPFGFLRQGGEAWLDRVTLKTGTMDEPHSVCGIAGYLRKKNGGWIAFAVIVNGSTTTRHIPLYKAMEASRADLESLLARY